MRPTLRAKVAFHKRPTIDGKVTWGLDWKFQRFPIFGSQRNFVNLSLPTVVDTILFGVSNRRVRELNRRA